MKNVFVVFLLALSFSASAMLIGKVDVQKILISVSDGVKVRDKLKKEFDKKQASLKKEEDRIRKMQEDFQKQGEIMNDKAKGKKQQEIQTEIMTLQQKTMGYQKEIQAMEMKLKKPILDKIQEIIQKVSKDEDVDITFEISTAPVIYAKNEKDLTDKVIKSYNSKDK